MHEEFIGLHEVPNISVSTLVSCVRDALIRINLSINKCRGQCYGGASNIEGARSGVASQTKNQELRAIFTQCYGDSLQLDVGDMIKRKHYSSKVFPKT